MRQNKACLEWGFVPGAWPEAVGDDRATLGMDYFRDWFIEAYSGNE